ncbi:MAG: T9SS type A sorting domain-containing protein [candidate division WOR-3 bacterium]
MMRCLVAGAVLLLLGCGVVWAGLVDTMWVQRWAGPDSVNFKLNRASDIAVDGAGNVYVCGSGEVVANNTDMVVAKFNKWGDLRWVRSYGGNVTSDDDMAQALVVDSAGNLFVAGATDNNHPNGTHLDITCCKFDSSGNLLWTRKLDFGDEDEAFDIELGRSQDLYLCGAVMDTHHDLSAFLVARLNPSTGDTVWTRRYILDTLALSPRRRVQDRHPDFVLWDDWASWDNCASALAIHPDSGTVVVTGFGYQNSDGWDIWTMKFLPNGTRLWERDWHWPGNYDYDDVAFDVAVARTGQIYLAGFCEDENQGYDYVVVRHAPSGGAPLNYVRTNIGTVDGDDYAVSLALDDSMPIQNVYVTGFVDYGYLTGGYQVLTQKYTGGLTARWGSGAYFGGGGNDYGFDICYNQGRVYVTGMMNNDLMVLCYTAQNAGFKETLWSYTYNSPFNLQDMGAAVCALDSDHVYVAGECGRATLASDLFTCRLFYPNPDLRVGAVIEPKDTVNYLATVTPQVRIGNVGNTRARFWTKISIDGGYQDSVSWPVWLYPGDSLDIIFRDWTAQPLGMLGIRCTVALNGDRNQLNNRVLDSVFVRLVQDAACRAILSPVGTIDTAVRVFPSALVKNNCAVPMTFDAWFVIDSAGLVEKYRRSVTVTGLSAGKESTLVFPEWEKPHLPGSYTTLCSLAVADTNAANNIKEGSFTVTTRRWPTGWVEVRSVPNLPSGKQVKDGGWLSLDPATRLIYAAKGNKTPDCYVYYVDGDSWHTLAPIKPGTENKLPKKGCVGVADGQGHIFMTKGNNTLGFWKYFIQGDSWQQLQDVPLGNSGKKVKGGTDMVYAVLNDTGFVYLLKGYKTDFLRYNTVSGQWQTLPDAPAGAYPKWDKGSWLAIDDDPTWIYAHKAKVHEFYRFELMNGAWDQLPLNGMPFIGSTGKSKKSKEGGCAAYHDGSIYALKGGNTCEFWRYFADRDSWCELETMPSVGSTGKRKRVKAGADIVSFGDGAFFALKGNKTLEFWRYVGSQLTELSTMPNRNGVMAQSQAVFRPMCAVIPNPLAGGIGRLHYSLPVSEPALIRVRVYDASGRQVKAISGWAITNTGNMKLDLTGLVSGVYLLRLDAGRSGLTDCYKLMVR